MMTHTVSETTFVQMSEVSEYFIFNILYAMPIFTKRVVPALTAFVGQSVRIACGFLPLPPPPPPTPGGTVRNYRSVEVG